MTKSKLLLLLLSSFMLLGCSNGSQTSSSGDGTTEVQLTMDNFKRYITSTYVDGANGIGGFSAWMEFEGVLKFAIYQATVTCQVSTPQGQNHYVDAVTLDASGGGKTKQYTFHSTITISNIEGSVRYRL